MALPAPTREHLDDAARSYFARYAAADDAPRGYKSDRIEEEASYDIHLEQEFLAQIEPELIARDFGASAHMAAQEILQIAGVDLDRTSPASVQAALVLGARALRELSKRRIDQLTRPDMALHSYDGLFNLARPAYPAPVAIAQPTLRSTTTIERATATYETRQLTRNLARSTVTETQRVLRWLAEAFGPETELASLSSTEMREFRDQLLRLDRRSQGREIPFAKRQTGNPEHQISYATAIKYWRFLQQFFRWAKEDRLIAEDPSAIAAPPKPKGIKRQSPPPFTTDELKALLASPLYAGHKSPKRLNEPGDCRVRGGHWWSGLVFMHTGLRAGELSQLMPSDFAFDAAVPHLMVRETSEEGANKSVKTAASIRQVPLHPTLLALGLEAFVRAQAKRRPNKRVFEVFRLGKHRASEGATRWWGDYLKDHGLWRPGRATHVWRHTFIRFLRDAGVAVEDIGALAGHSGSDMADPFAHAQTKAYGSGYSLERKLAAIQRLDFGFDVSSAAEKTSTC